MTTEEVSKVIRRLCKVDAICGRFVDYQKEALSDIWNRTAGNIEYKTVIKEMKKIRYTQNKKPSFSPAMFVTFTLAEALEIFKDYSVKISLGTGFSYCGFPAEESERDVEIRDNILREHYGRRVVEIYPSVYQKKLIIRTEGDTRGTFWDEDEYEKWKERVK